jgi:hypothetical protein
VVGEMKDGEETVTLAVELDPDVVIVDFKMPKLNDIIVATWSHPLCFAGFSYEGYYFSAARYPVDTD